MIHDMNDKMSRYNKKMGTRKFPYDKLVVSLRETGGFLTRNLKLLTSFLSQMAQMTRILCGGERTLRYALMLVMMLMGVNVWGQTGTDRSGLYYIASGDVEGYVYDPGAPANNYYLVPAANPQQTHYADAYFHNQYCNTNGSGDYTGNNYGDPQKPFLTTYKTNQDNNSLWVLQKSNESGLYYIVHVFTGKYVVYEPPYKDKKNRKSMHLLSTESPGANAKFAITGSSSYQFRPSSVTTGSCFFNPASGNRDQYYGTNNADNGAYWAGGIVGLYTEGSWKLETTLLTAPTISDVDESTNTFTITDANSLPEGYTIRYTTDGTPPTATTGTKYNGPVIVTNNWTVMAVVVRYDMVLTEIQTKSVEPARCKTPVISYITETGKVSIASETPNANIRYTLNGTDPTSGSTLYGEPFDVTDQQTVKAIATNTDLGFRDSEIASSKLVLNATITLAENECTYDGSAKKPAVSVMDGETTIDDDEYDVSYENNTNAGNEAVVTITDKEGGDYIVYGTSTFTIEKAALTTMTLATPTVVYNGLEQSTEVTSVMAGSLTVPATDYTVSGNTGTNAGNYTVTATAKDETNFTGQTTATFTIDSKSLGEVTLGEGITMTLAKESDNYVIIVKDGNKTLTAVTDYTVSGPVDAVPYHTWAVAGTGNYGGLVELTYVDLTLQAVVGGNGELGTTFVGNADMATPQGMTTYIVTSIGPTNQMAILQSVEYIPKDVPVLLLTMNDVSGFVKQSPSGVTSITSDQEAANQLKVQSAVQALGTAEVYLFYKGEFVLNAAGNLPAGKVYLEKDSGVSPSKLRLAMRQTTDMKGIHQMDSRQTDGGWYTLDGRRLVGKPTIKGVYINDGHKLVIR